MIKTAADVPCCDLIDWPVYVRFVENGAAGTKGLPWGVRDLEEYVEGVHDEFLGTQAGWDRWVDNHVGLELDSNYGQGYLDHVGRALASNGVKFHAHVTFRNDSAAGASGSIWTQGVGGLAMEIHGAFDWSWFNASDMAVHGMSMCDHNSEEPLEFLHDGTQETAPRAQKLSEADDDDDEESGSAPTGYEALGEAIEKRRRGGA